MSINLNQIYCNHYLKNEKLQGYCKNPQFESFPYPPHTVLTSFHIKDSIHYNALITNNYEKKIIYKFRLLGIINSILGKKSYYRIKN